MRRMFLVAVLLALVFVGLTDTGQDFIVAVLRGRQAAKAVRFVCPVRAKSGLQETATCPDCTYYPVDKDHALPADYLPDVIDTGLPGGGFIAPIAKAPLQALFAEATWRELSPVVTSAYRSYKTQTAVFRSWVFSELVQTHDWLRAIANAERYSARPGHSEHQLGTAIDINCARCVPFDDQDERNTALWKFLETDAYRYGFVLSYPRGMENRTGYQYEPWHVRYVGVDLATALFEQGYTEGSGACLSALLREAAMY
jgi:D-alanyl-D-alanine carboxypeptidase